MEVRELLACIPLLLTAFMFVKCEGGQTSQVPRRQAVLEALSAAHQVAAGRIHNLQPPGNKTKASDSEKGKPLSDKTANHISANNKKYFHHKLAKQVPREVNKSSTIVNMHPLTHKYGRKRVGIGVTSNKLLTSWSKMQNSRAPFRTKLLHSKERGAVNGVWRPGLQTNYMPLGLRRRKTWAKYRNNEYPRGNFKISPLNSPAEKRNGGLFPGKATFSAKSLANLTSGYGWLGGHGAKFEASKIYVPTPFYFQLEKKEAEEKTPHRKQSPHNEIHPTQTTNIRPAFPVYKPVRKPSSSFTPTQTTFIANKTRKKGGKNKKYNNRCSGKRSELCGNVRSFVKSRRQIPEKKPFSNKMNRLKALWGIKTHHTRQRRQLSFLGQDSIGQQLLQGLATQPVLPDTQRVLGLLGAQPQDIGGGITSPLIGLQTQQLVPSLLGNQEPLSLVQSPLMEPQQQVPLTQVVQARDSLPFLSSPGNPITSLGYQGQISQGLTQLPEIVPGQARGGIPLRPRVSYGNAPDIAQYDYGDAYYRHPVRRPVRRYHRHHRRHYLFRRPAGYGSFEDTYGKSPGIFDDLKVIGSQMASDDGDYSARYAHRRHRGHRHHLRDWDEMSDFHVENTPIEAYMPRDGEEDPRDDSKDEYSEGRGQPEEDREEEKGTSRILSAGNNKMSTAETANQENTPQKNSAQDVSQDKAVEYAHNNTADAFAVPETSEAERKRNEILSKLDKEAVMHLDFNQESQQKNIVQDASSNGNSADLTNGAAITTKNLGTCGRGAMLKKGEVSYRGKNFTNKPTDAVSIAMWVKSKSTGFIRWFDQGDGAKSFFASTKSAAVPKKRWTHLAGSFDSKTGMARIYVDGQLKLEKVGKKNQGLPQDFTSAGIGRKFGDDHVTFLDDVYMFDKVITPEEVAALYRKCEFNRMVLHYGFQHWNATTKVLNDQSGLQNNGTLRSGAHVLTKGCDKCGACLDLSSNDQAQVYLDSSKYKRKPTSAVSLSAWVSLNRTRGLHSIFQALKGKTGDTSLYNLEVIDGKVHWQCRNKNGISLFDVLTKEVTIPEGLWTHVSGTYNSKTGSAKIFVNGLLRGSFINTSRPKLSAAWGRASIGGHIPDNKPFNGLLDEFFMYNWELDPSETKFVLKYCAEKPKLVSFTVKVPIL